VHRPQQRYLQGVAGARRLGDFVLRLLAGRRRDPRGQRLREAFEELGPIFVKFGQVLSTRRQDQVARVRGEFLRQALEVCARFVRADHALQRRRRVASQHGPDGACHHALIEGT